MSLAPSRTRELIIAPPPTPNGDLHVGHMSGPYLAADMYARHARQYGTLTAYAVSTDDSQSYVDTTAERLGVSRTELVGQARRQIGSTFDRYAIALDNFGDQNADYARYVRNFFQHLFRSQLIKCEEVDVFYNSASGTYPVEAEVKGRCPGCLMKACGGICEACGRPNTCIDLLQLETARLEVKREVRLVLDLERYRNLIEARLAHMGPFRPALTALLEQLLARPLEPFVLSYKRQHGISADFAGLPDQVLNVWGEMYPGHLYFLDKAVSGLNAQDSYVQFLGFDNSYFYALVHTCLNALALQCGLECPEHAALVTNQFYLLDDAKFSTSLGHVIWARDLCKTYAADAIRLYLALRGPEYQEVSFSRETFERSIERIADSINKIVARFNEPRAHGADAPLPQQIRNLFARMPAKQFSQSKLARQAIAAIEFLAQDSQQAQSSIAYAPSVLLRSLEPLCPQYAAELRQRFPMDPTSSQSPFSRATSGQLPRFLVKVAS